MVASYTGTSSFFSCSSLSSFLAALSFSSSPFSFFGELSGGACVCSCGVPLLPPPPFFLFTDAGDFLPSIVASLEELKLSEEELNSRLTNPTRFALDPEPRCCGSMLSGEVFFSFFLTSKGVITPVSYTHLTLPTILRV